VEAAGGCAQNVSTHFFMTKTLIFILTILTLQGHSDICSPKYFSFKDSCSAKDFLLLRDKVTQSDFFRQRDSVRKIQYPLGDQDTCNSVDITKNMLQQFLKDIDINLLLKTNTFESTYFFNIAPPQFSDSKKCKDIIRLQYFPSSCTFRLVIDNVYLVENTDCIGGSQVVYSFKIVNGRLSDFWRNEAG